MSISIKTYLDSRRAKSATSTKAIYPVKLRIYDSNTRKTKLFNIGIDSTISDYEKITSLKQGQRLSSEQKVLQKKLIYFQARAQEEVNKIDLFTFEIFEKRFYRKSNSGALVKYHYEEKIKLLLEREKVSTADSYKYSLNSFKNFLTENNKSIDALRFSEINKRWLENYEHFMVTKGKSKATIGIYLRPLCSIFNIAIEENDIPKELYPFGKKRYVIPKGRGVKKALSKTEISILLNSKPETQHQEKARDFWMLSYCLNGINFQDLLTLKKKELKKDKIEFVREKTKDTNKVEQILSAPLIDFSKKIINKYMNKSNSLYLFDFVKDDMAKTEIRRAVKLFTKYVNQHLKILAENNNLPKEISTYWARHSMASIGVKNMGMEFVQEILGHSDLKTTQRYFAGFESDDNKQFAEHLMNFDND